MSKVTLPSIVSGYLSAGKLNEALLAIAEAFENTLSRDGTTPNQMEADLDLNGHSIINTSAGEGDDSLVTRGDMVDYIDAASDGLVIQRQESQTATTSQTIFTLTTMQYEPGAYNLAVYVDGVRKFAPTDYVETSQTVVTFLAGQTLGAKVQFVTNEFLGNITIATHTHTWSQISNAPIYTTRWPDWTEVTGKPSTFTASAHNHAASEITSGRLVDARRGVYVQGSEPTGLGAGDVGVLWFN